MSSTTFGINNKSLFCQLNGFDITSCFPFDIMHTVFEGVAKRHLCISLTISLTKQSFSLHDLNHAISTRYSELDTRPTLINQQSSSSSSKFHITESGILWQCAIHYSTLYIHLHTLLWSSFPKDDTGPSISIHYGPHGRRKWWTLGCISVIVGYLFHINYIQSYTSYSNKTGMDGWRVVGSYCWFIWGRCHYTKNAPPSSLKRTNRIVCNCIPIYRHNNS